MWGQDMCRKTLCCSRFCSGPKTAPEHASLNQRTGKAWDEWSGISRPGPLWLRGLRWVTVLSGTQGGGLNPILSFPGQSMSFPRVGLEGEHVHIPDH